MLGISNKIARKVGGVLVFLFASCFPSCSLQKCIVPDNGIQGSPSCKTIDQFCEDAGSISDNTVVTVLSGTHRLNRSCGIQALSNITLKSQNGSKVIIKCSHELDSGFTFLNVSVLKISGIEFTSCGAPWPEGIEPAWIKAIVALLFIRGSNLTLTNITVPDVKSTGIIIHDVAGNVTLDSCKVANSSAARESFGNIWVYSDENTSLTIINSLTINGTAWNENRAAGGLTLILGNSDIAVDIINTSVNASHATEGGNMAVFYCDSASVTISNSIFSEGESNDGGGLSVSLAPGACDVPSFPKHVSLKLNIINSTFTRNKGGGVSIEFEGWTEVYGHIHISIINSTFTKNSAGSGRGGAVYIEWQPEMKGEGHIDIINTSFDDNSLGTRSVNGGLAIYLFDIPKIDESEMTSVITNNVKVNISRCKFFDHGHNLCFSGVSIISATRVPYLGIDGISVKSNKCTAIKATGSSIVFSGSTIISNNTAVTGAGLQLVDTLIFLTANTELSITNNSVQQTGGGVQIIHPGCMAADICCFFQPLDHSGSIKFMVNNNHAPEGGDNVFGAENCDFEHLSLTIAPQNTINEPSSISSQPGQVCLGKLSEETWCNNSGSFTVYPGEEVYVFMYLVGQSNGLVSGTVSASTAGDAAIIDNEGSQKVSLFGSSISYTVYSSTAYNLTKSTLTLKPVKTAITFTAVPSQIEIFFRDCPFGFDIIHIYPGAFACHCTSKPQIINCSIDSQTIIKNKYSWIGMFQWHNHSYLAANDYCPLDYCNPTFQEIKSHPDHLDQDEQCQYNRTGILCGSCPEGWSLVLGSSECREKCSNVWLLLILPFALAGLLLVVVIHFLNLTVTMGTVCGLIFYANVIQDYSTTLLSRHPIPGLTPILQVFLSWLNLDLGITTCFYDGMEAFGKTMLLFVFPIYIWLISATIIILSNRYIFFTRLFGEASIKVLSTLFLLSYSKMIRVTIGALNLKSINVYIGNSTPLSEVRWALDGNIPYFDTQRHLALFVIAILFIMLLLPFSMSLLCIRHVYSLSNCCRVFSWIDKLKPFFDIYTGPFKDKARFWTGLLLFVRLLFLIVHTPDYRDNTIPYYIIVTFCFLLSAIMILLKGAYRKGCLNILEYFFIVNIGILFLTNTHKGGSDLWKSISSHLLVSSAFLAFLGIVIYHAYLKFSHLGLLKKFFIRPWNADPDYDRLSCEGMRGYEPVEQDLDTTAQYENE